MKISGAPVESNDPVSMVLLLREPQFLNADQLCAVAEKAFGSRFVVLRTGTKNRDVKGDYKHCLIPAGLTTLLRAGPHALSFLNVPRPYGEGDFAEEFGESLPLESQRRAWTTHQSFTAVDYVKGGKDLELEYAVLAKLCEKMLDDNCAALYVPGEGLLIPSDGSITQELRSIASAREVNTV